MEWFVRASAVGAEHQQPPQEQQAGGGPINKAVRRPPIATASFGCPQGDPTFLYGGFGYRPPNFGYAWLGTGGATSFSQLPVQQNASSGSVTPSPPVTSPKSLAKSASAPDLANAAALVQNRQQQQQQQQHLTPQPARAAQQATPPLAKHRLAFATSAVGSGASGYSTPQQQSTANNTPAGSRPSTPPPRTGYDIDSGYYIGMAAA